MVRTFPVPEPRFRRLNLSFDLERNKTEYRSKNHQKNRTAIVVDLGSWQCRVGWATDSEPRLVFDSVIVKNRDRGTGEVSIVVGDGEKSGAKSPFFQGTSVVVHPELLETLFGFVFEHMGIPTNLTRIDHPIVITECPCNPTGSSSLVISECLLGVFKVPHVAYGIGALFSFHYNHSISASTGIAIDFGHNSTHIIPIIDGKVVLEHTKRINVGGSHASEFLLRLLQFKYPNFSAAKLSLIDAQSILFEHGYVSADYYHEMQLIDDLEYLDSIDHAIQFPFTPVSSELGVDAQQIAEQKREVLKQRMKEQVTKSRQEQLKKKEQELSSLSSLIANSNLDKSILKKYGFKNEQELHAAISKLEEEVSKIQNKLLGVESEPEKPKEKPDFSLVGVPDLELNEEQKKEKRKQRLLKAGWDAREKMRSEKEAARLKEEEEARLDEEFRTSNPEAWLLSIRQKYADLKAKIDARKKQAQAAADRKGQAARARMKALASITADDQLTTSGNKRKKRGENDDDGFGADDADWAVYNEARLSAEEEDDEEAEASLQKYEVLLMQYDSQFKTDEELEIEGRSKSSFYRQRFGPTGHVDEDDSQGQATLHVNIERMRVPEILFQPGIIGIEQAGVAETLEAVLSNFSPSQQKIMVTNIHLCGSHSLYQGLAERIEAEVRMIRPEGDEIRVIKARDGLDIWRGAARYAERENFDQMNKRRETEAFR